MTFPCLCPCPWSAGISCRVAGGGPGTAGSLIGICIAPSPAAAALGPAAAGGTAGAGTPALIGFGRAGPGRGGGAYKSPVMVIQTK